MDLYDGRWFRATTREALCKDSELRACFEAFKSFMREQRAVWYINMWRQNEKIEHVVEPFDWMCDLGSAKKSVHVSMSPNRGRRESLPFRQTVRCILLTDDGKSLNWQTGRNNIRSCFRRQYGDHLWSNISPTTIIMTKSSAYFWRIRPDHVDRWVLCTHSYLHSKKEFTIDDSLITKFSIRQWTTVIFLYWHCLITVFETNLYLLTVERTEWWWEIIGSVLEIRTTLWHVEIKISSDRHTIQCRLWCMINIIFNLWWESST
jgi:hypothetical protein